MGDFKKKHKGFGGGHGGGFDRRGGGARNFERPSWESGDRNRGMHRATCAQCNNPCEVPFRPVDGRPVYCSDCFRSKREGGFGGQDKFASRNFTSPKPAFRPEYGGGFGKGNDNELKKQLEILNAKIDRLIKVVEIMGNQKSAGAEIKSVEEIRAVPVNAFPDIKAKKPANKAEKSVKKSAKKAPKKSKK